MMFSRVSKYNLIGDYKSPVAMQHAPQVEVYTDVEGIGIIEMLPIGDNPVADVAEGAKEMERIMNVKIDSTLERQINTARLSPSDRQVALNALHLANAIVDAVVWCVKKIEQFGVPTVLKPSLKH